MFYGVTIIQFFKKIIAIVVFLTFFCVLFLKAQESVQLGLSVVNSYEADMSISDSNVTFYSGIYYTRFTGVDTIFSANQTTKYNATGDLQSYVFGSGVDVYSHDVTIQLLVGDGYKYIYPWFEKQYTGGFVEKKTIDTKYVFLDTVEPSAISLLEPSNNTEQVDNVLFRWESGIDTGSGIKGYILTISTDVSMNNLVLSEELTGTSYMVDVDNLGGSSKYYWQVITKDRAGNTSRSDIGNFTIKKSQAASYVSHGRGGRLTRDTTIDYCPEGDNSPSYYDRSCGPKTRYQEHISHFVADSQEYENVSNSYNWELYTAYKYARYYNITTMDLEEVDLFGVLLRKHFAKMIVNYASGVMYLGPTVNTGCDYSDIGMESEELQNYMILACKFGLMGLKYDGTPDTVFNPNEPVTRAMFATVFSRLLFGGKYNGNKKVWFADHINALKQAEIMNIINDPYRAELRGYAFIMMKRANDKGYVYIRMNK